MCDPGVIVEDWVLEGIITSPRGRLLQICHHYCLHHHLPASSSNSTCRWKHDDILEPGLKYLGKCLYCLVGCSCYQLINEMEIWRARSNKSGSLRPQQICGDWLVGNPSDSSRIHIFVQLPTTFLFLEQCWHRCFNPQPPRLICSASCTKVPGGAAALWSPLVKPNQFQEEKRHNCVAARYEEQYVLKERKGSRGEARKRIALSSPSSQSSPSGSHLLFQG